jgi:hypothetical protein
MTRTTLAVYAALAALGAAAHPIAMAASEPLVEFVVAPGDTLISLSKNVFVSPDAWNEVAALNKLPDKNRIQPGQVLRVPERLMRARPQSAKVLNVAGDVKAIDAGGSARALAAGDTVAEGTRLQSGAGGSAVVGLADGSRMKLLPDSVAALEQSRSYGARSDTPTGDPQRDGWFAGTMRLLSGSLETAASKIRRAKPLEVSTPTAVIGVRGTQYRVSASGDGAQAASRTEVLEGQVRADSSVSPAGADVAVGFGAALDASGAPPVVRPLLPAPSLDGVPQRFEVPVVSFNAPSSDTPVRVQVASDESFDSVVRDVRADAAAPVRIADLADGTWWLRARKVDDKGIEGYDAKRAFVLKAQPTPPAPAAPRGAEVRPLGPIELSWAASPQAERYHLQVARDAQFRELVHELGAVADTRVQLEFNTPGTWHWRLAGTRTLADGKTDRGPWGAGQTFQSKPVPAAPQGGVKDGWLLVTWSPSTRGTYQVEIARDAEFKQVVTSAPALSTQWLTAEPTEPGRYYFRYRIVETDGWVSLPSSVLAFEVQEKRRPAWWSFVPFFGTR